jgi:hypothetical protein
VRFGVCGAQRSARPTPMYLLLADTLAKRLACLTQRQK